MSNDDRFQKAKRLAELTKSGQGYIRGSKQTVDPDSPRGVHEATMGRHKSERSHSILRILRPSQYCAVLYTFELKG